MFRIIKRSFLVLSSVVLIGGTSALAQEEVTFQFDPSSSVEQNYEDFKSTAKRACNRTPYFYPYKLVLACRADLLEQAINGVGMNVLTMHHQSSLSEIKFAENKTFDSASMEASHQSIE